MSDLDRLAKKIAQEVYAQLAGGNGQCDGCASGDGCCCVSDRPEAVAELVAAGAGRIGGTIGVGHVRPDLADLIDHTLLKQDTTYEQIGELCTEAKQYGFCSVCVNPCWVSHCAELLAGSSVKVCTVIGFPLGANTSDIKALEARKAQEDGATELDMVVNIGALKTGDFDYVERDIRAVVSQARAGVLVKVIIEAAMLTDEEKVAACEAAVRAGAHFVKTSTGFGPGGATAADIALMRRVVGPDLGVKASGGVGDCERADLMVRAGATRIGASAGVMIVSQCGVPGGAGGGY